MWLRFHFYWADWYILRNELLSYIILKRNAKLLSKVTLSVYTPFCKWISFLMIIILNLKTFPIHHCDLDLHFLGHSQHWMSPYKLTGHIYFLFYGVPTCDFWPFCYGIFLFVPFIVICRLLKILNIKLT
jgi:hypothetical protein